jgi:hypothetical protein
VGRDECLVGSNANAAIDKARTELDVTVQTEQHIVRLDIPMDDPMSMQMLEALTRLPAHRRDLALRHQIRRDHVRQAPALHVLHDDPEVVLMQEAVDVVHDVRVPARAHDEDLVDDQVLLRLLVEVHLLDRYGEVGADLVGGVHASGSTVNMNMKMNMKMIPSVSESSSQSHMQSTPTPVQSSPNSYTTA